MKKIVLSLIKDDLLNTKLINGLTDLGLDASEYMLELSNSIFDLIGLQELSRKESRILDTYMEMARKVDKVNIEISRKPLEILALEIYVALLEFKYSIPAAPSPA